MEEQIRGYHCHLSPKHRQHSLDVWSKVTFLRRLEGSFFPLRMLLLLFLGSNSKSGAVLLLSRFRNKSECRSQIVLNTHKNKHPLRGNIKFHGCKTHETDSAILRPNGKKRCFLLFLALAMTSQTFGLAVNKNPTRCNSMQIFIYCKATPALLCSFAVNKYLHTVASGCIFINIELRCREPWA